MGYTRIKKNPAYNKTKRVKKTRGAPVIKKETWLGLVKKIHKEKKKDNKNWTFKDSLQLAKKQWRGGDDK